MPITKAQMLALLADNTSGDISAQDMRDIITGLVSFDEAIPDAVSIFSSVRAAQILVANTAEKLEWMGAVLVDNGGDAIEYTLLNHDFLIKEAAIYKIFGVITIIAPVNNEVDIELRINNIGTGIISSAVGRGDGLRVSFMYTSLAPFNINDNVSLYIKSTGTSITIQSSSMTVEKTAY